MIFILEGCNGTGKSTYAAALSKRLDATVLRPFRQGPDHHFDGSTNLERELKNMGVPYNTHVDDLYVADILGRLTANGSCPNVILDRSFGSAIAHGNRPITDAGRLIDLFDRLVGANTPLVYVWLTAPWHVVEERLLARDAHDPMASAPARDRYLHGMFRHVYELMHRVKLEIDTSKLSLAQGIDAILKTSQVRR